MQLILHLFAKVTPVHDVVFVLLYYSCARQVENKLKSVQHASLNITGTEQPTPKRC
jgi:hypothetical protein